MKHPIGVQRLAYVFNFDMPSRTAGSIHAAKMCQALVQEGYSPTLFAFRQLHLESPKSTFYYHYGIQDVFDIELIHSRKLLRGHDFAFRAAYSIKRQKFPAVFSRGLLTAMWTAIWGISTIYETHQPPGERLGQYYQRVLFSRKAFQRLVVISDVLKIHYLEYYPMLLSYEQIIVEPDAVDLERFEPLSDVRSARLKLHLSEDVFTVGYSGHLYEGRGIDLILELAKRLPTVNFILMGGEETHIENWRHVIRDRKLQNVTLMGFVPNTELPLYLAACNVLLMPYQHNIQVHGSTISTHEWMSPMKMFEYMAAKRLIISSDFPILRTVLHHEQNAVLCPPDAVDDWERGIRKAMENPSWAQKLADQARHDVENYTWRKRVQRIMSQVE